MRSRKIFDFENYGSLPQSRAERVALAKQIRVLINREFAGFVRKQESSVTGLPGFWLDKTGRIQLWSEKDYSCPMMLIPFRAASGLIQACQIRFMSRTPLPVTFATFGCLLRIKIAAIAVVPRCTLPRIVIKSTNRYASLKAH